VRVCVCICVCASVCICVCTRVRVCSYEEGHISDHINCICPHIYIWTRQSHLGSCVCACVCERERVCVCMCVYTRVYMIMWRSTHKQSYQLYMPTYIYTADPTWGDIFECCSKAQSSTLESVFLLKRGKRDVRALSCQLSKMSPQVGLAVHEGVHINVTQRKHLHIVSVSHKECIYILYQCHVYIYYMCISRRRAYQCRIKEYMYIMSHFCTPSPNLRRPRISNPTVYAQPITHPIKKN